MRLFEVLAELVLLVHLLWILWVILGWRVTRNRRLFACLHIGSLFWGIAMEVGPWPCPLTITEPSGCHYRKFRPDTRRSTN